MNNLPIYKIKGNFYFLDNRLNEYRNINNPADILNFNSVDLNDLEIPTEKDKIKVYGVKKWDVINAIKN